MNLRSVDLNLLVILDALLEEAHVSRAATRLGLSQPATSSALERCRHLFRDPLLARGPGGMRLTPRAEALRQPLKALLEGVTTVLDPPAPDLHGLRQAVRVVMADQPATTLAAPLHRQLAQTAPGIDLIILPWHGAAAALEALGRGAVDLAVSVFPDPAPGFRRELLLQEHYRVLMRRQHPAAPSFGLESWLAYSHVLVSGRGGTHGALDQALADRGLSRRVAVVVPSFAMVPPLLAGSDLIAMLPSRCLPGAGSSDFLDFPPPLPVPGFPLHLAWHARRDADLGTRHVAGLIRQLLV
jgi:DNA-binding transcriptional LysR family regulator